MCSGPSLRWGEEKREGWAGGGEQRCSAPRPGPRGDWAASSTSSSSRSQIGHVRRCKYNLLLQDRLLELASQNNVLLLERLKEQGEESSRR